ncbi:unnamed protein product [Lampetra planeri]
MLRLRSLTAAELRQGAALEDDAMDPTSVEASTLSGPPRPPRGGLLVRHGSRAIVGGWQAKRCESQLGSDRLGGRRLRRTLALLSCDRIVMGRRRPSANLVREPARGSGYHRPPSEFPFVM